MNNPIAVLDAPYRFGPPTLVDVTTSVPTDADTAPTWQVYEDGSAMSGQSGTLTKLASLTGVYEATFTPTTANGFEVGKDYTLVVAAQVDGVAGVYKIGFVVDVRSSTLSSAIIGVSALANAANENAQLAATHGNTLVSRLSSSRAGYLDKLNVAGTLAHSGNADTFKADVSGLASQSSVNALPTAAAVASAVAGSTPAAGFFDNQPASGGDPSDWPAAKAAIAAIETRVQLGVPNAAPGASGGVARKSDVDSIEGGGGGTVIPVNQVAVPLEQTWILTSRGSALVGELALYCYDTDEKLYAIDFRRDLPTNGTLVELLAAEIVTGEADGLTFGADSDVDEWGVDGTQAKLLIEAVTAGTYVVEVRVRYSAAAGGSIATARVKLIVRD
jgi:hypothetical protein